MGDVASLAVGLHLNAANFKSQLMSAYGSAESQSRQFNRNARADAKKTEDAYKRVSASVSGLAGRLAGFAGAGLSLGTIISTTRQYSQSLSDLQAITGATSAQMKLYDQAAQEMGRTTEYSASQAAEAIKLMASAKPELLSTSAGLTAATKSALTLAQAAGTTLPDATRTLALSLNQFGAGASEADRYINVLAAGAKFGSSEIAAAAIKNGGVAAAQAGVGFETLNAAIQVLAEREVKGGEAGTALRNVILNLEKGTDKTLKPSVVGLSQALENLAGKNLSTRQAVKLFGEENLSAASILVQNREKVESLTAALTGTQTAHEQAEIRVNNLNGDLLSLTSAFEGLIIKVGQSGNGPLRSGVQTVTDAINGLTDNFNTVANVALYTLIPVLATKLTAGIRGNIGAWVEQQQAVRASAMAQADMARKTLESTAATLAQNNAEFGRYRQMEKSARQFGLNVSYQSEFNRLIRQETEQTLLSTQAKSQLNAANKQLSVSARAVSAAVGMARGALALVGGPVGAAMLAGSALLYFHNQAKNARQSAIDLKNAVVETNEELKKLSLNQLNVKQLDIDEQFENQVIQRNKLIKEIQDAESRIDGLSGFDPFGQLKGVQNDKTRYKGDLDAVEQGLKLLKERQKIVKEAIEQAKSGKTDPTPKPDKPGNETGSDKPDTPWTGEGGDTGKGQKAKVNQYEQLRREIEAAHSSSLGRINLQEQESARKLLEAARADGASEADIQKTLLLNAENYQKQRLELAEQYAPARASLTKERESSQELKSLLNARLLDEKEYQTARITLAQSTARELLQAQAAAMSAPLIDIAGTVDPLAELRNQLAERQSLLQAFYQNDAINKEQYELLKQKADKDSADAQYQTAVELYKSQGNLNSLAIGMLETTQERSTNMLTGMLVNTQSLRDGMIGLFSSLTQSVIKNLVDMATQALITNTILKSIMGIGGSLFGGAASASTGTAISSFGSSFSFNEKGGVYDSPSLSAYSNGIYDSPTLFAFAKGAGVFGEAGPEAIMPLAKTTDGTLGVRALGEPGSSGGGMNGGIVYSPEYHIIIQNDGQNGQIGPQASQMLVKMVDTRVMSILRTQGRDGGMLAGG